MAAECCILGVYCSLLIEKTPRIQYLLLASITGAFFFFKIKKHF